jgi:hypothetical protein
LLLIVDLICDWARRTYRRNVQKCLAQDTSLLRQLSPALTEQSSQALGSGAARGGSVESRLESNSRPQSSYGVGATNADIPMLDTSGGAEIVASIGTDLASILEKADPLLTGHEIGVVSGDLDHWTNTVAVRNIDVILFQFCHISLPHQLPALGQCLRTLLPHLTVFEAAENIHNLFVTEGISLSTISLAEIESWWTKSGSAANSEQEVVLKMLVRMHTFVRKEDWRITRALICISCTQEAADCLSEVSQRPRMSSIGRERWIAHRCSSISNAVSCVKWPPRFFAACAAIGAGSLSLTCSSQDQDSDHLTWILSHHSHLFESVQHNDVQVGGNFVHRRRYALQRSKPGAVVPLVGWQRPMDTAYLAGKRVIMLLKSDWFPSKAQDFCLLLMQPLDNADRASLVAIVEDAILSPMTEWTVPSELEESKQEELSDFCEYWVTVLKEEA